MGRALSRITLAALLLGTMGAEARAGEEDLLGSRVRVRTIQPGEPRVGVFEQSTPDELVIRTGGPDSPVRVRRADVAGLEVSRGTRRHALKGLLAGAVAWGALVGLVAAFDTLDESGVGEPLVIGGMLAAGAGVGALVKTERWERVPAGEASIQIGPVRGGLQVRVVVGF
ncbi:MAG TPA: hypothetical protein VGB87_21040 [Vicinamibacteria bacterium]